MSEARLPTRDEVVLGALLHDIGKFMQRAHGTVAELPERSREMDNVLCPVREGRYSHKHILWTDAFFEWLEGEGLSLPQGVDRQQVRDFANFHHAPDRHPVPAMGWLSAEADRLASGLDRKPKEHDYEVKHGWETFRKQPLASLFDRIDLGEGKAALHVYDLAPLGPGEVVEPRPKSEWDAHPGAMDYRVLWDGFKADFTRLCREGTGSVRLFAEGLLGLLERYTWAIPSSTIDIPDISLFDHARITAAIAACGRATLEAEGRLTDEDYVRDRTAPRYRLVAGDLSGIQKAIFKLASEGVAGLARTLRARSFYLGALTDAAALWLLHDLGLPSCCRLQAAGGRFLLLVPATAQVEGRVANVRDRIRRWLLQRYYGELTLHLVVGAPFAGEAFLESGFFEWVDAVGLALEEAKLAPPLPEDGAVLDWVQFHPEGGMAPPAPARSVASVPRPARTIAAGGVRCATKRRGSAAGSPTRRASAGRWRRSIAATKVGASAIRSPFSAGKQTARPSTSPFTASYPAFSTTSCGSRRSAGRGVARCFPSVFWRTTARASGMAPGISFRPTIDSRRSPTRPGRTRATATSSPSSTSPTWRRRSRPIDPCAASPTSRPSRPTSTTWG